MSNQKLKFSRGLEGQLPSTYNDGEVRFCTDTGSLFIDSENGRVKIAAGKADSAKILETARTITIGNTSKDFDGAKNISWTLDEIGAAPDGLWSESWINILVEGEADTYYPVIITSSYYPGFPWARLSISRSYSWTAPLVLE